MYDGNEKISDSILLEKVRLDSDSEAYCCLYLKYYPVLVAYAEMFVSTEDAEDIVQDHLLRLWKNRQCGASINSLNAFLFTCVRNTCLDKIRHSKFHHGSVTELWESLTESTTEVGNCHVSEIRQIVLDALNELPEPQRRAFEMSRFEGKTYHSIALSMGVSQKTIEYRISRALAKLSCALSDYLP